MQMNARLGNLLGTLALALFDGMRGSAEKASGRVLSDVAALNLVANCPRQPIDLLAKSLGITPAGTSRLADRLEEDQLVTRVAGEKDGRSRGLVLTEAGQAVAGTVLRAREAAIERALAPLSPSERALLTGMLENILEAITEDRWTAERHCRLCDIASCPPDSCPVEQAARATER